MQLYLVLVMFIFNMLDEKVLNFTVEQDLLEVVTNEHLQVEWTAILVRLKVEAAHVLKILCHVVRAKYLFY